MKDVVVGRWVDDPERRLVWEIPPAGYNGLSKTISAAPSDFPLLHSICAHDEGPEGDFTIQLEQLDSFVGEIDRFLASVGSRPELRSMLSEFRALAVTAKAQGLAIFGYAD